MAGLIFEPHPPIFENQYNFWRYLNDIKMIFWYLYFFQRSVWNVQSISVACPWIVHQNAANSSKAGQDFSIHVRQPKRITVIYNWEFHLEIINCQSFFGKKMLKNSRKKQVRNFLSAVIIDESLKYFQLFYANWKWTIFSGLDSQK